LIRFKGSLLRNLARRLERDWGGVSAAILEGLDEMLTVTKLGLPAELRRSLACRNGAALRRASLPHLVPPSTVCIGAFSQRSTYSKTQEVWQSFRIARIRRA